MNKNENGFAIIIALLIVATMSAVVAAGFFVSVADLKISFNRIAIGKSLREAERVLVEAEISIEQCLKGNDEKCVSEIIGEVTGANAEFPGVSETFILTALGRSGNFSTEIQAVYSVRNGNVTMNSWRRKLERNPK
ncbi:MAG: hypothetical protein GKS04_01875 [Candidatus Mycalebacterium zealandia]|nr:MAG: hypothetical protein GKS04_01875 [Candidatus Mycalebacterium zealandia]